MDTIYLVYESGEKLSSRIGRSWVVPDVRNSVDAHIRVEQYLEKTKQNPITESVFFLELSTLPELVDWSWDYN